jgi:hypothetical protein
MKRIKIALVFCIIAFLETGCGNKVNNGDMESSNDDIISNNEHKIPDKNYGHSPEAPKSVYEFLIKRINKDSLLKYCGNERAIFVVSLGVKDSVIKDCRIWYHKLDIEGNYVNTKKGLSYIKESFLNEKVDFKFIGNAPGYGFWINIPKLCSYEK